MKSQNGARIAPPEFGASMTPAHPSREAQTMLALRRSTSADLLTEPGPDDDTLSAMLEIAARVPDHRRVYPFRIIVLRGDARSRAGAILAKSFSTQNPEASEARIEAERRRFERAPVVILIVAKIDPGHKTPEWEQVLTVGAVCQNLLLAASAYGFAANWLTEWYSYDADTVKGLGLRPGEKAAGFVYVGTAAESPKERQRPNMADIVSEF